VSDRLHRGHHARRVYRHICIIGDTWSKENKIVRCMSSQKGVMLMLLYTEIQTVTFGRMKTNNAHLSKPISVRI
jgi:hypothetical protein